MQIDERNEEHRRTCWRERGNGRFVLVVDGRERGIAHTDNNSGVILSEAGRPGYKFFAPESRVIFDEVERRAGISGPVTEFRTAQGNKTNIPWRAMAERRAAAFRARCAGDGEAAYYAQLAWVTLSQQVVFEPLNPKANDARFDLAGALRELHASEWQWSAEARRRLAAARDALRRAPEKREELFQPEARLACERALAALDLSGLERGLGREEGKGSGDVRADDSAAATGDGWKRNAAITEREARKALEAAHKVLSDVARASGLDPDAERARDLCAKTLEKLGRGQRRARSF